MKTILILLLVPLIAPAMAADVPAGLWRFVDDDSVIEFKRCDGDALCAVLRKLPNAKTLATLSATQQREAPSWCGKPLLGDLKPDGVGVWRGGWVYDPESAKRYSATLKQTQDKLKLLAFVGTEWLAESMVLEPWQGAAPSCR